MYSSCLTTKLDIMYPIIQAGMAGGITTPELVSAVSNAGGLGSIGAGYMNPENLRTSIQRTRERTDKPFAVNLFVPNEVAASEQTIKKASEQLQPFYESLGVHLDELPTTFQQPFEEQVTIILEEEVPVVSFTFGIPPQETINLLKRENIYLIGTATTVEEAIAQEDAGMDAVVAQGSEAGGHRGTFSSPFKQALIGTMSLVPQVVDHVSIPVIAAGGIMDARGLLAARALGAQAGQMGTAFLTCVESGANSVYQEAILASSETDTTITEVFSGKPARGIANTFIRDMQDRKTEVAPYPIQNTLTSKLRREASKQSNKEFMSLWAGQGTRMSKKESVATFMQDIVKQYEQLTRNA